MNDPDEHTLDEAWGEADAPSPAVPGESEEVAKWARHLIGLSRQVRSAGDFPMVLLSDDGVEQTYPLSDQLYLVAVNLDYAAVMAMPPEPGPDDAPGFL